LLWGERLSILYNRLWIIILQLIYRETVSDSLLFVVLMCVLFWVLSTHAGYMLNRHGHAWWSILPTGLTIFTIHSFDALISQRTWYLAVYIFFSLMLVARMVYLQNERHWQTVRTALPPHLGFDFTRFTIFAVTIIVLLAWTIPALGNALPVAQKAWQPVQFAWNKLRSDFEDFFAPLRSSIALTSEIYGNSVSLGRGSPLSDSQVFAVRAPLGLPSTIRMYWRARTYETYINGQWFSTNLRVRNFIPERDNFPVLDPFGRWLGTFEFIAVSPIATMYTPAQPLWVNHPAQVEYYENADGTQDVTTFRAMPSIDPGYVYSVQASVSYATITQLKAAVEDYPDWVKERYLQLPTSITPRTRQLAEDITFGLETPYEKAAAITNYLRKNIEYVDTIKKTQPSNQEILDWFLFDLHQGFCNYYASAEVVLLRAVGIPARYSLGYASGERVIDERTNQALYTVLQRNAHAWPEVYFPSIGWVEFEPTVSQPEIVRLAGDNSPDSSNINPPELDPEGRDHHLSADDLARLQAERNAAGSTQAQQKGMNVVYWMVLLAVAGGLVFLGIRYRTRLVLPPAPILLEKAFIRAGLQPPKAVQLWARRAMLPPLARAYLEINHALKRLGRLPSNTDTPAERADLLSQELPSVRRPAHRLVHEYQIETFSNQSANLVVAVKSAIEIKDASIQAYFKRLFSRLQRKPQGKK
jgi:hypothetical protein